MTARKKYDVIIVGAGMAGMTAAIYVARAGKSVLMLEGRVQGGQIINTLNIANWPGDLGVSGAELMQKIYKQALELSVEVEFETVVKISRSDDNEALFVIETDETNYLCSAVIIAAGTEPRKLSEKQMSEVGKRPVSYCATCDGAFFKGKPVVVVGHGNSAKHEVEYLSGICSKVYQIHHDDPIPEDAEAVFVAIGRVPLTEFLQGLVDLDTDGYVVADEDCETSCPGIFVAGDVRTKSTRQLVTAAGDGAVAAGNALKFLSRK